MYSGKARLDNHNLKPFRFKPTPPSVYSQSRINQFLLLFAYTTAMK